MLRRMTVMLLCVLLALCAAGCGGVPEEKLARAGEDCTALVEEYNALAKTLGRAPWRPTRTTPLLWMS